MTSVALPLPTIPDLWDRARRLYAAVLMRLGAPQLLPRTMTRRQRADANAWLEPVEKLVRSLLITNAIVHLVMTEEGRQLREAGAANPMKPPTFGRHQTPDGAKPTTIILHREAEAAAATPAEGASPTHQPLATQTHTQRLDDDDHTANPVFTDAEFRVLAWVDNERYYSGPPPRPQREANAAPAANRARRPSRIAVRMALLERVLANQAAFVLQLAAYIARLPGGLPLEHKTIHVNRARWPHGNMEVAQASWHEAPASVALESARAQMLASHDDTS